MAVEFRALLEHWSAAHHSNNMLACLCCTINDVDVHANAIGPSLLTIVLWLNCSWQTLAEIAFRQVLCA